ncbi:MAG: prepilin-type N-terminal cleavage/methylation domain-containing protein, partial [Actinomycetota bacterium]
MKSEDGFSLVEVMASMVIFTIITLGIAPLMAISLRGTNTGRIGTVGKELA